MGSIRTIGRIALLLLVYTCAYSQNYIEFVENKGQWDQKIKFKGDVGNGAFLLQPTGYRVVLYNMSDMSRIRENMHHGSSAGSTDASAPTQQTNAISKPVTPGNPGSPGGGDIIRGHVYEMRFINANPDPVIIPDKPSVSVSNYFIGNDSSKWASNCRNYQGITYKNVYPNIDVRYYTSNGMLKYDFIVNPGGDVANIAMYFDGVDELKLKDKALHVKTSVDEVVEMPPYTFQLVNGTRQEIPCSYDVKGSIVRFRLSGPYVTSSTLVIDPSLVFSTFSGSRADNWAYTATYDGSGNFYAGGIVFPSPANGFPVSNGAFQQSFQGGSNNTGEQNGGFDMGIMKFDPSGNNRIYATYIGGSGNEQPHSLVVDRAGNLVIAGRSSSSDYPTRGALKTFGPLGGLWDIVVTKLNANGTDLIGSVRIGGTGDDGVNIQAKYKVRGPASIDRNYGDDARSEVILDGSGNVYFASCTQSANFPVTAVSGQTTIAPNPSGGRVQDAVLVKLAPDLSSVLFSVLIGGTGDDAGFVLSINPSNGNVFMAGATTSTDFPGSKTGVKYPNFQGGLCDGFVAEFTGIGSLVRSSYFGTPGNDIIYGIQFDRFGMLYFTGTTTGDWPVINAAFSQPSGRQFIAKVKPDLSDFIYSTIFGSGAATPNLSPTAFLVDRCENVYVSGWGGGLNIEDGFPNSGTKGLPVTPDAYQKQTDGMDMYFFVLAKNAQTQLYGSFFGQVGPLGEHVDGGTSRFDQNGVIYQSICANCGEPRAQFPTTPGAWAATNGSSAGNCNLAAVKIAFNLAGIGAGIQASVNGVVHDTSGCAPLKVDFADTLAMGQKYVWDFADGSPQVTTQGPATSHQFNAVGQYRVRLVSIDSTSCNIADTAYVLIRVRTDEVAMSFTSQKIPPCTSLTYQFTNTSKAIRPFTSTSFIWDFGDGVRQPAGAGTVTHSYAAPGTYNVRLVLVDTNYCNEPDSITQQMRLSTTVKAQFTTPASGCVPYTALFTNTSLGGSQFTWDFGDGTSSSQTDPQHLYANTGSYKVRLIAVDTNTCNKVDTSAYFTITVNPNPSSSFSYTPNPTQENTPVTFLNSSSGASRYKWVFGDGDTLNTIRPDTTVAHLYNASGTFNTCLVSYNAAGCSDTSCQKISVVISSLLDVPNAFSPNGDGVNDKIFVRGFGISKMVWTIYNRWGKIVYQGTNISEGWDGTVNGRLQPQDVYHYTLQVDFTNKDRATKKGDITLLR